MLMFKQILAVIFFLAMLFVIINLTSCTVLEKGCKYDGNRTPVIEMKIMDSEGNIIK